MANERLRWVWAALAGLAIGSIGFAQGVTYTVTKERVVFPAHIDGRDYQLESMLYRPAGEMPSPLVVFSHGRNGMTSPFDPNTVNGYSEICNALARRGYVVAYVVRRGYGYSEGPDSELQDTAVLSGLEAAKDYKAAVAYWRLKPFVLPDKVLLMGQSQGGWAVLACTNVAMPGVLGVVNISGGTNYRLMGTGAVTPAVQDHWVAGCAELGRGALVPSFWVYSENDQSISGATARRMFAAFTASGGVASLLMLPPYGSNGHAIVGQPDLFMPQLEEFFGSLRFVPAVAAVPTIVSLNGPAAVFPGGTAVLTADVSGEPVPAVRWQKDGSDLVDTADISGASSLTLTIKKVAAADAGTYGVRATNSAGTVTSRGIALLVRERPVQITVPNGDAQAQIINLSTRGIVATGENVLIAGFVIAGTVPKKMLILGSGLNLDRRFGIAGAIGRPRLELHQHRGDSSPIIAANSNWESNRAEIAAAIDQVGAQPLSASSDKAHGDAGLLVVVEPGVYSVVVSPDRDSANLDGIGLLELYDNSPCDGSRLTNLSSRGVVESGDRQMIVGVVVTGSANRLMIRSVGPGLRTMGVQRPLLNPTQSLHRHLGGATNVIATNDDWWDGAAADQSAALASVVGAFALQEGSGDSAIVMTLDPGVYSSVVADRHGTPGVVLTEIYDATLR